MGKSRDTSKTPAGTGKASKSEISGTEVKEPAALPLEDPVPVSISSAKGTKKKAGDGETGSHAEPHAPDRLEAPKNGVVVRMYRQGLGDCFLLAFGGPKGGLDDTKYVVIDCGVLNSQKEGSQRLAIVMENLVAATGGKIDVLVATHEHADHLSGFLMKGNPFLEKRIEIKYLWLAWTERFGDELADKLRQKHGQAQQTLEKAAREIINRGNPGFASKVRGIVDFEQMPDGVMSHDEILASISDESLKKLVSADKAAMPVKSSGPGVTTTEPRPPKPTIKLAIQILKELAGESNTTYCYPGQLMELDGIGGMRVHVLGPPRDKDEVLIKRDLPSENERIKEVYLSAATTNTGFVLSPALTAEIGAGGPERADPFRDFPSDARSPFGRSLQIPLRLSAKLESLPVQDPEEPRYPSEATRKLLNERYFDARWNWRRIDGDWLNVAEQLALNLDSDTNNTSLALAFEWGPEGQEKVFLFPGDAQVGNWLSWRRQKYGKSATISVHDLFARTVLYKVGHHGSHNATLKRDPGDSAGAAATPYGLELMDDIIALIPVDFATAEGAFFGRGGPKNGTAAAASNSETKFMPHKPLYEALRTKAKLRVLRSDETILPLSVESDPDLDLDSIPGSHELTAVPGLKNVRWRRSAELLGENHPMFYEMHFEQTVK